MSKYSLIIWDLDGTIIDPATGIIDSVRYALERLGIEELDNDVLRKFIGPPLAASFMDLAGLDEKSAEEAVRLYRENFSGNGAMYKDNPFDGIPEVLNSVHEAGLTQVIATSKPTLFAEELIRFHGLGGFFCHIQGSNMDGSGASKYDVIREALKKVKRFNASETIVIGDRRYEADAANRLGFDSVFVSYGYGTYQEIIESEPTFIAGRPSDLREILF